MVVQLGERVQGTVSGIEVEGYWTGRGILVQRMEREDEYALVPLVMWDQSSKMTPARLVGKHFIQIGAEYALDTEPIPVQD